MVGEWWVNGGCPTECPTKPPQASPGKPGRISHKLPLQKGLGKSRTPILNCLPIFLHSLLEVLVLHVLLILSHGHGWAVPPLAHQTDAAPSPFQLSVKAGFQHPPVVLAPIFLFVLFRCFGRAPWHQISGLHSAFPASHFLLTRAEGEAAQLYFLRLRRLASTHCAGSELGPSD